MSLWIVEPRDTLVVRDGRPIGEGSAVMRSLDYPWPSTTAGFVRSRIGRGADGVFRLTPDVARAIAVKGPLLGHLAETGELAELVVPAPRDCLFHPASSAGKLARRRLQPVEVPDGSKNDLDTGVLVGTVADLPSEKPARGPAFWRWSELEPWLTAPPHEEDVGSSFGLRALVHESRTHVAMDPRTDTGLDGMLFSTEGLRFTLDGLRLAVVFECGDDRLGPGLATLGGERRVSFLRRSALELPGPPAGLAESLARRRTARLILLTPAIFSGGHAPTSRSFGAGAKMVACVVPRADVISGWDFERRGGTERGPKVTRRMAPAGSVYWVELDARLEVDRWLRDAWCSCVSDAPGDEGARDRRDGFGLCVVGVG